MPAPAERNVLTSLSVPAILCTAAFVLSLRGRNSRRARDPHGFRMARILCRGFAPRELKERNAFDRRCARYSVDGFDGNLHRCVDDSVFVSDQLCWRAPEGVSQQATRRPNHHGSSCVCGGFVFVVVLDLPLQKGAAHASVFSGAPDRIDRTVLQGSSPSHGYVNQGDNERWSGARRARGYSDATAVFWSSLLRECLIKLNNWI